MPVFKGRMKCATFALFLAALVSVGDCTAIEPQTLTLNVDLVRSVDQQLLEVGERLPIVIPQKNDFLFSLQKSLDAPERLKLVFSSPEFELEIGNPRRISYEGVGQFAVTVEDGIFPELRIEELMLGEVSFQPLSTRVAPNGGDLIVAAGAAKGRTDVLVFRVRIN